MQVWDNVRNQKTPAEFSQQYLFEVQQQSYFCPTPFFHKYGVKQNTLHVCVRKAKLLPHRLEETSFWCLSSQDLMIKKMLSVNPEERPEAKAVQGVLEKSKPCERMTVWDR